MPDTATALRECAVCQTEIPPEEAGLSRRRWDHYRGTSVTQYLHDECGVVCAYTYCGMVLDRDEARAYNDELYCDDHFRTCYDCGDAIFADSGGISYSDRRDAWVCDECWDSSVDEYDDDEEVGGLRGYGRTRGVHWLGGPLPKDERDRQVGFYIGFELEVSARGGHVSPLADWARDNLGHDDDLDFKEDSSVDGFEIATQPMTPEFFESVDWDSFFDVLNRTFPTSGRYCDGSGDEAEPDAHGLHVHIGRVAFERDDVALAMFAYLIGQDQGAHLVRIGRRKPTHYCDTVPYPASSAILSKKRNTRQGKRLQGKAYVGRDAINLTNEATVEIRAFRSTRNPQHLRDAVRMVYLAANYVRSLRAGRQYPAPKALHWSAFAAWVKENHPAAYSSIAGE